MAAHAHERPAAGRAAVVGRGGGDVVATQRRWDGWGFTPGKYTTVPDGCRRSLIPVPPSDAITLGQYLSPGVDHHPGGVAQSPAPPARPLRSRAVAAVRSRSHTERTYGCTPRSVKTLPLKGSSGSPVLQAEKGATKRTERWASWEGDYPMLTL